MPDAPIIPPDVLAILRCPVTGGTLHQEGDCLVADADGRRYPIRDGIPVLLPEQSMPSSDAR